MTLHRLATGVLLAAALAAPLHAAGPVLVRVHFAVGSSELDERAMEILNAALPVLQSEYRWQRIEIAGHADKTAGELPNVELSRARAQSVYDYLAANGMDMEFMTVSAYGESRPRVPEVDAAARAQNRRVELVLLDNPEPGNFSVPAD